MSSVRQIDAEFVRKQMTGTSEVNSAKLLVVSTRIVAFKFASSEFSGRRIVDTEPIVGLTPRKNFFSLENRPGDGDVGVGLFHYCTRRGCNGIFVGARAWGVARGVGQIVAGRVCFVVEN